MRDHPSSEATAKGYIEIKTHSYRKYNILGKYLVQCKGFSDKYQNFVYIDTHGGTGQVLDVGESTLKPGSVLRAAQIQPSFPVHAVEINPIRHGLLNVSVRNFTNVRTYFGDCYRHIDSILSQIPKWQKFALFFVDPDGLVYNERGERCQQVRSEMVNKIAKFPRSEILLNFPLQAIMESSGNVKGDPTSSSSKKKAEDLNIFFGTDNWKQYEPGDYQGLLRAFIQARIRPNYKYVGAILIRTTEMRAPQFYLIHGSTWDKGGIIMRNIMKKEWVDILGQYPLTRNDYDTDIAWLTAQYPLELFIFDN